MRAEFVLRWDMGKWRGGGFKWPASRLFVLVPIGTSVAPACEGGGVESDFGFSRKWPL